MNRNLSAVRILANAGPWLAPLPAAWFAGRAVWLHLLVTWADGRYSVPSLVHLGIATVAGLSIEILSVVSVHNALALYRWNTQGRVEVGNWERAPFPLTVAALVMYAVSAGILLVLLEAVPQAARFTPALFSVLGLVAGLNLGVLDEHRSRLARYGLSWDLSRTRPAKRTSGQDRPAPSRSPSRPVRDLDPIERQLLHLLEEDPALTYRQLATSLGTSKSSVGTRVLALQGEGWLQRTATGLHVKTNGRPRAQEPREEITTHG